MSRLLLIRHGQGTLDGGPYDNLSELGRKQAEALGKYWVSRGLQLDIAYCGTLNRHKQTAETVVKTFREAGLQFPEIIYESRFNEIDSHEILTHISNRLAEEDAEFKKLAKETKAAFRDNAPNKIKLFNQLYLKIMFAWINNKYDDFEGITWEDFRQGVLDTRHLFTDFEPEHRIVVFTSGNPMGIFVQEALGLTIEKMLELVDYLYNTNITTFLIKKDRLKLVSLNETAHLQDEEITRK